GALRLRTARLPVRREPPMDLQSGDSLSPWCGWAFAVAGSAGYIPFGHRRSGFLAFHRDTHQGILFPLSAAADRDGGDLCRSRSLPLLRILGTVAGADGDSDCHVRSEPGTSGRVEVFPVHVSALSVVACCYC